VSAAVLHGTKWIDAEHPAELFRIGAVQGILIHRDKLAEDEVCVIDGMPATTPARTAFDLGRRGRLETAIVRLDALACATKLERRHVDRSSNGTAARGASSSCGRRST
jgi:hypothetical protein